jgi:vancomycin resistance protein YoaR
VRHGLGFRTVAGRTGVALDRTAAGHVLVASLSSFDRAPATLPVRTTEPKVEAEQLAGALQQARRAVSAPVRLVVAARAFRLPRWRLAQLLELPADGRTSLAIGGAAADGYFRKLARTVDTKPRDARFAVDGRKVRIVPSKPGVGLDVTASAKAILAAATSGGPREARLVTEQTRPQLTTAKAQTMGIKGLVSSYETIYGGDANRRHNVQLVAHLVDNHLIKPGEEFSFNKTTGERSAEKGFLEAPVIINGEVQTGLGGGVCQVSTTVFNAAFDAGLSITDRTNHALYISHYPLGRDATVDYPSVDLKFKNDTGHWLLLRTFVGDSSLVVNLYGTDPHRKVEVETAPLRVVSPAPVEKVKDPSLAKGETEVEEYGVPAQATSVHRRVFSANGKLMYDTTWSSSYRAEPEVIRVGTEKPAKTTTRQTTTTQTTTQQTTTAPSPPDAKPATPARASAGR